MSLTAKVIRLAWRSLDMLDPAQVARDMRRPEQLVARLREAARPERRVVVVLQEDEKLFSLVLGALIALRDELEGDLVLVATDPRQLDFIAMLGLTGVLPRFASVDEALAARGWRRAPAEPVVAYEILD